MCDRLTLLDGTELWSAGQLVDEGLLPKSRLRQPMYGGGAHDPRDECLCRDDLPTVLARSGRKWKEGVFGWHEIDDEGRCYWEDGLMEGSREEATEDMCAIVHLVPDPSYPHHKPGTFD